MTPPAPALVVRFRADLLRVAGPLAPDARLGVAASGGPDSLALLLLARAALPGQVEAATVDHGLRPTGAEEAAQVARLCLDLAVPHAALRDPAPPPANAGQAWARDLRYRLLACWIAEQRLAAVLTAHHADDQAETLLLRLNRGSGLAGLAGVRAAGEVAGATVLRPLLGWRRAELRALVEAAGLAPVDDPSNADPRFDRTRVRDLLGREPSLDPARLAASAAHLADAEEALVWAAERAFAERRAHAGRVLTFDPSGLPHEFRRRLLLLALAEFGVRRPDGPAVARLLASLLAGSSGTLGPVVARGGSRWTFSRAPPRRGTTG